MRAALIVLAAGPMLRLAAGFAPAPAQSTADPTILIEHRTVRALAIRHAARFKRLRRGHQLAVLTPQGQYLAARVLAAEADRLAEAAP